MTLDTAVLADLAAKAKAATPGPWDWRETYAWPPDQTEGGLFSKAGRGLYDDPFGLIVEPTGYEAEGIRLSNPDAAYIAAFSPDVAAALLAEVESLRKVRDAAERLANLAENGWTGDSEQAAWGALRAALVSEEGSR